MTDRTQMARLSVYDFEDFWNLLADKLVTFQSPISIVTNYNIKKNIRIPVFVKDYTRHKISLRCTKWHSLILFGHFLLNRYIPSQPCTWWHEVLQSERHTFRQNWPYMFFGHLSVQFSAYQPSGHANDTYMIQTFILTSNPMNYFCNKDILSSPYI